jgi:small subunit ribosomal protein S16
MVRIRLRRVGAKGQASYRVVAADKESPRDGRFLEILGFYNPRTEPATIQLKEDRIFDWISKGAQPSDSILKIFKVTGTLERYQRFKEGEDLDILLEEAKAGDLTRNISPKTTHVIKNKRISKKKESMAQAEAESETETPVEA